MSGAVPNMTRSLAAFRLREAGGADVPQWDNTLSSACQCRVPSLPFMTPLGKMTRLEA